MKILVAIANHGTKNKKFLDRLIAEYRGMKAHTVDIVVLSNVPKDCGSGIEVLVGAPLKNPWSLPFAHKRVFAERVERYDLFIYSEDDTPITERNIAAFLRATRILPKDHIAGFIRFEIAEDGSRTYTTMHGHYHWDANSVLRLADHTFAYYTNEHSACYLLTQEQMRRAIASGGFLRPAREGRYDMLVTAATDPYTQCGLRKMICISHFDDFCLHHLPDVYWHRMGLPATVVEREVKALQSSASDGRANGPLFRADPLLSDASWDKNYYEPVCEDVARAVPPEVKTLLSVGCGCGATEERLKQRGIEVTGIPLDRIVGITAAAKGIKVLSPAMDPALAEINDQRFDCILLNHALCHFPDPEAVVRQLRRLLHERSCLIATWRNGGKLWQLRTPELRAASAWFASQADIYDRVRFHFAGFGRMKKWLAGGGLQVERVDANVPQRLRWLCRLLFGLVDNLMARDFLVVCRPRPD